MVYRSTYQLFIEALNVINAALDANRHSAVVGPVIAASERWLDDVDLGVEIHSAENPQKRLDHYTIRMNDGAFVLVARGPLHTDVAWKVSDRYLRDVAGNPQVYIEAPWKLDLDWLCDRVSMAIVQMADGNVTAGNGDGGQGERRGQSRSARQSHETLHRKGFVEIRLQAGD